MTEPAALPDPELPGRICVGLGKLALSGYFMVLVCFLAKVVEGLLVAPDRALVVCFDFRRILRILMFLRVQI